jgi:hypothetical protein
MHLFGTKPIKPLMKKIAFYLPIILLLLNSCSNEFENADPALLAPGEEEVDPQNPDNPGQEVPLQPFSKNSELYSLIKRTVQHTNNPMEDIMCIDFIYPLIMKKYNEELTATETVLLQSDAAFYNFLVTLNPNQPISLSYPITATDENGQVLSVNNNEELKNIMKNCSHDDVVAYCNGTFSETENADCYWRVPYEQGKDNLYAGGTFLVNQDHSLVFDYDGTEYPGNWVFLYAADELHMNINLEGSSDMATYWNIDRKVTMTSTKINIFTEPKIIKLERYCGTTDAYAIGDTGPGNGTVFYDKGSYSHGWRYLEASTGDMALSEWGCSNILAYPAASTSGTINSARIVYTHDELNSYYTNPAVCSTTNNGTVAARRALVLEYGNKNDWFLPSKEELLLMYNNLYLAGLGNFSPDVYWSSTETDSGHAKAIDFSNASEMDAPKTPTTPIHARAIRYF